MVSNSHGVVRLASSGMVVFVSPVGAAYIPILTSRVFFLWGGDLIRGPVLATHTNREGMVLFLYLVGRDTSTFLQFVILIFVFHKRVRVGHTHESRAHCLKVNLCKKYMQWVLSSQHMLFGCEYVST